ncbi:hypothetical protein [Aeromonas diversa]|uniref:hypothetical protein n=1 Tax=Aeromonas diversa TaxID=502790 RepID=UPI003462A0C7
MTMTPSNIRYADFIEIQRSIFGFTGTLLCGQLQLPKQLAIGVGDDQAIKDIAAFRAAGHFVFNPEDIMPLGMTSGLGMPVRLVVYYDRAPVAYAVGYMTNVSIDLTFWEVSRQAPDEVVTHWLPILTASLEDLSVGVQHLSQNEIKIQQFAFTSPAPCDIIAFKSVGFSHVESYTKGIPAVVTYRHSGS